MEQETKRPRLSVDLTPHKDIQEMLSLAMVATGKDTAELVIESLRDKLPELVEKYEAERQSALEAFRKNFKPQTRPPARAAKDAHARAEKLRS